MKRRTLLAAAAGVALAGCPTPEEDDPPTEEREPPETEPPDTDPPEEEEEDLIDSLDELLDALESATRGDDVTVDPDAEISLEDHWEISVPAGVTLDGADDEGMPGALLKSPEEDKTPEANAAIRKFKLEPEARFTGFRLEGHYHEYVNPEEEYDGEYWAHRGGGGVSAGVDAEVDNNEISGWPYTAVFARGNAHVHNNYIHHNTWEGLGYGVAVPTGNHMPIIESNYFNYNRHSITAAGGSEVGYLARFNLVGEEWVGSQFDMHGTEGMDGIAGEQIIIYQNTFKATRAVEAKTRNPGGEYYAVDIRGEPTEGAWIEGNWFYHEDRESAVRQPRRFESVYFEDNHYGENEPLEQDLGAPELTLETAAAAAARTYR